MPSRRQFVQATLATASFGAALKLSAGCTPVNISDRSSAISYNILCCDGGGLKGLITTRILVRLEEKLKERFPDAPQIRDHFSLMAGTSTGSIIACGLAQGIPAEKIAQFYSDKTTTEAIFPSFLGLLRIFVTDQLKQLPAQLEKAFEKVSLLIEKTIQGCTELINQLLKRINKGDFSIPLLEKGASSLEQILQQVFNPDPANNPEHPSLQDLERSVVAVAYDAFNRKPILLSNIAPQPGEADTRNVKIWEACRASSAVPGIFPSYVLGEEKLVESIAPQNYGILPSEIAGLPLIDGVVVTNNPSLWAIQKATQETNEQRPILVASFGTGQSLSSTPPAKIVAWGLLDWFNPLKGVPMLEVMLSGNSGTVDSISKQLVGTENYLRFQPDLNQLGFADISAFTSDEDNLKKMEDAATAYLQNGGEVLLDQLIDRLGQEKA